ncbi:ATP-dependent zinc protease family protein [Vibrio algicola]|uniref:Retropepsin-like aspartic endopeptidase domain-containing protein n=1 Tax=Vibrio algicola TaxID=2662262 RepID=A0A5Q0TG96_9VIBR|nr:RimK/LysX family protein [Vibrio algicola]
MFKWLIIALFSCSFSAIAAEKAQPVSTVTAKDIPVATHLKNGDLILGETEWVYVSDINRNIKARIDTGATTSSISAVNIRLYKKDGKNMVDYKLAHDDWTSKLFTAPVKRWVEVKQASTTKASASRPVIDLNIQIGDHKTKSDFTLVDRSQLEFPVLIGRTFIDKEAVVDVSHAYLQPKTKLAAETKTAK